MDQAFINQASVRRSYIIETEEVFGGRVETWRIYPYALLTTWGTASLPQISATAGTSSAARGAKHDVVVTTATISSGPPGTEKI